ncbi:MAG TPA: hypothetical protein QGH10_15590, partial [Armatimonadota bacterium]|nr:hypothetical protein [Armatimonadota bacterium]
PMLYCGRQHGSVLLVVGAQDEYFPLYCTKTSAEASGDDDFRMLIVANWDHGYFAGDNPHVDAFDNRSEAKAKELRAVTAAINSRLKTQGDLPEAPRLTVSRDGDALLFSVEATGVESATVQVSVDGAYTLTELPATPDGDAFVAELAGPDSAVLDGAAAYAEVYYSDGPVLTSIPWFGPAFEQRMRAYPEPDED